MVELPPAGGLEVEYAEVAVALEVARDKDNDVKPAATLVRRQTDVSLMALSLFCYMTIVTKIYRRKRAAEPPLCVTQGAIRSGIRRSAPPSLHLHLPLPPRHPPCHRLVSHVPSLQMDMCMQPP